MRFLLIIAATDHSESRASGLLESDLLLGLFAVFVRFVCFEGGLIHRFLAEAFSIAVENRRNLYKWTYRWNGVFFSPNLRDTVE